MYKSDFKASNRVRGQGARVPKKRSIHGGGYVSPPEVHPPEAGGQAFWADACNLSPLVDTAIGH